MNPNRIGGAILHMRAAGRQRGLSLRTARWDEQHECLRVDSQIPSSTSTETSFCRAVCALINHLCRSARAGAYRSEPELASPVISRYALRHAFADRATAAHSCAG